MADDPTGTRTDDSPTPAAQPAPGPRPQPEGRDPHDAGDPSTGRGAPAGGDSRPTYEPL
ncbi:hypothetical protein [Micromonospora rubida]|uniref:hypothetical protein n=1 Tax=Micromonospora rubida TaxID=2697657 RepID=UPI001378AE0B|nr:hypothetical protein [Micromonospora rubida]NBE80114.1 hypothetical protein [Micromonospora rubida]